ncbi:unannotated protein [freshwater metagenome]|uniref:Unannotated protein n=1 Tax=freshwater metagenome TaxID=449393 RepID=A0A6J6EYP0_9ZZZZ
MNHLDPATRQCGSNNGQNLGHAGARCSRGDVLKQVGIAIGRRCVNRGTHDEALPTGVNLFAEPRPHS